MISKVKISSNRFINLCQYVCSDPNRAEVLSANGVREDYKEMARDFESLRENTRKKNVVFHGILSFPKGENISDSDLKKISEAYLDRLGLGNSPFAIVKHKDKEHVHVHVISSLIDFDEKVVNDSYIGLRAKKIAQALTLEFGLTPADSKHLGETNLNALKGKDLDKYKMYLIVNNTLPKCHSFEEFEKKLKEKGIELLYKYKRGSDEIQGVSFRNPDGYTIKGSELDRKFSYKNLKTNFDQKLTSSNPEPQITYKFFNSTPPVPNSKDSLPYDKESSITRVNEDVGNKTHDTDDFMFLNAKKKKRKGLPF